MNAPAAERKTILLANPRGFCAGVERAIRIVEEALQRFGAPIYVRHEIVHNRFVVDGLRAQGAIFVDELRDVPNGATVIFSAHGVPACVREEAARRALRVFDATCPLVSKVHREVIRLHAQGFHIIMIGHRGHPEVEGTMGQVPAGITLVETAEDVARLQTAPATPLAFVTQTTLSVDDAADIIAALRQRFPDIRGPHKDDICYATQSRQDAVKALAAECDAIYVVGSINSSNSKRLREVACRAGVPAWLIDSAEDIRPDELAALPAARRIGITAGASAPEVLVAAVIDRLRTLGFDAVTQQDGKTENITFHLPKELHA